MEAFKGNAPPFQNEKITHTNANEVSPDWDLHCYKAIAAKEQRDWLQQVNTKPKLRTYKLLKWKLKTEKYLIESDGEQSVYDIFKLRSGTHILHIDTGRSERTRNAFTGEMMERPLNERTCLVCHCDEVEDETHFLCECPRFKDEREDAFIRIRRALWDAVPLRFDGLRNDQLLQLLLFGEAFNDVYKLVKPIVKTFIAKIYKKRLSLSRYL